MLRRERIPETSSGRNLGPRVDGGNRVGKYPDELRQVNALFLFIPPKRARLSFNRVSAAASDNPTGERLYMSMTEEGYSGDYKMSMQSDRHGRWMPIKGERTMNIRKQGRRRSFYVGESKEYGTFSIASAEASTLYGEFSLSRRNAEVSWKHPSAEQQTKFSKAIETEWKGVLDFKAVTIIDSKQSM